MQNARLAGQTTPSFEATVMFTGIKPPPPMCRLLPCLFAASLSLSSSLFVSLFLVVCLPVFSPSPKRKAIGSAPSHCSSPLLFVTLPNTRSTPPPTPTKHDQLRKTGRETRGSHTQHDTKASAQRVRTALGGSHFHCESEVPFSDSYRCLIV